MNFFKKISTHRHAFNESLMQAYDSLRNNKLRTFLSLLGITIGIFCIITVKSAIDSLQDGILEGFSELGSDMVYVSKMPWDEDPGRNYWKYLKRPEPSYEDFLYVKQRSKKSMYSSYAAFTGGRNIKHNTETVSNAFVMGATFEQIYTGNMEFEYGRHFTQNENFNGDHKAILGHNVYTSLFPAGSGIGESVKVFGRKYTVIGKLAAEGQSFFNFINYDDIIWIPFSNFEKYVNVQNEAGISFSLKAKKNTSIEDLKSETIGLMRSSRKLKPIMLSNFSVNELSLLSNVLDQVFGVMNIAGFLIGIFALIVGMFSVANIMFVSVKERTSIIGIKKALGAKKSIILLEFLLESILLCLLGGFIGLVLVILTLWGVSSLTGFQMQMSSTNLITGIGASIIVGIIAGIIPAYNASNMDPVEAIRA